eukprot:3087874-Rhodomonas_salina.1
MRDPRRSSTAAAPQSKGSLAPPRVKGLGSASNPAAWPRRRRGSSMCSGRWPGPTCRGPLPAARGRRPPDEAWFLARRFTKRRLRGIQVQPPPRLRTLRGVRHRVRLCSRRACRRTALLPGVQKRAENGSGVVRVPRRGLRRTWIDWQPRRRSVV